MPTEVRLTGVTCLYDTEQDPPAFSCNWYGFEVPTNDTFVLTGIETDDVPVGDTLAGLLTAADYEFE